MVNFNLSGNTKGNRKGAASKGFTLLELLSLTNLSNVIALKIRLLVSKIDVLDKIRSL
ncbi:hypothetical protein PAXY110619_14955 [Paenibacillus xylanexedens]|uniref:Prepilin-type N-terminal cleavage/methylation domain-containing protein n=1 Tax=Paenibacillus xylanexedens TaxID=528191 RepID=A0ABS4RQP7_PAEXY|nr:hypothetical protein [Paenibacillus xylanexedens]